MKDIDFDELDKAVNSLMTRTQKEKPDGSVASDATAASSASSRDEPGIPTTAAPISPGTVKPKSAEAMNPDLQPAVVPAVPPQPTSQTKTSPSPSPRPAPAARRSGRFMDVVPQKAAASLSRPTSREGVTLSPRSGVGTDMSASPGKTPSAVASPTPPVTEKVAPKSDWPDPIEVAIARKPPVDNKEPETIPDEPTVPEPSKEENPKDQPLTSPFLPNAKVEKRPLGSPASNLPMNAPESELMKTPSPDDSEAQLPAKPGDISTEAPEEFGGDIMKVEADTHMGVPKTDESHEQEFAAEAMSAPSQAAGIMTPQKEDVEKQTIEEEEGSPEKQAPKAKASEKAEDLTATEAPSASGRISIPPQYKEQPSTGDTESGAIYDTSTYHQPLMHPTKKKSGWLWVLWIVLILIVGAGAGAALYFLGVM